MGVQASANGTREETLRLHQANERTMLAWIRTGIALMAFGFAIARFGLFLRQVAAVGAVALPHAPKLGSAWIGATLVALGMVANLFATIRFHRIRVAIERGQVGEPGAVLVYVFGTMATILGLIMALLLMRSIGAE